MRIRQTISTIAVILTTGLSFGDPFISSHMNLPIKLGTNQVPVINAELNQPDLRETVAKAVNLDLKTSLALEYKVEGYRHFTCIGNGADHDAVEMYTVRMFWYAAARGQGHSKEYAIAGLTERGTNLFLYPATPKEVVLRQHPDIPPSWLRPFAGRSNTFFLVDNGLAYAYGYNPIDNGDDRGTNYCPYAEYGGMCVSDANELDPKRALIIDQVRKEANATLEKLGRKRGDLGACHEQWREMKRILKEKHQIDWKTPAEVNPSIIFD